MASGPGPSGRLSGRIADLAVSVADLLPHPGSKKRIQREVLLDGLEVSASRVPAGELVAVDVELQAVNDGIVAVGWAKASWVGECRRCLQSTGGTIEGGIADEVFERHPVEGETWPLRDATIDLTELVREAVILGLPLAPLCEDDCAGLCPTCGVNRNEGDCACAAQESDPRWAALSDLRFED